MAAIREFDPLSKYFLDHPYEEFARMREEAPVYRHEGTILPVVSFFRNDDIREMLQDWETWSSQRSLEYNKQALGELAILIGNDPPLHTKYRKVVAPLFLPREMEELIPWIEQQSRRALEECLAKDEFEFVEEYAARVTVAVICRWLRIPEERWDDVRRWTKDIALRDGCAVFLKEPDIENEERLARNIAEMGEFFTEHVEKHREEGRDDLLRQIMDTMETPGHMIGMLGLMAGAGNETTTNLMAHGMQELLRHPDQQQMLRDDPSLIDSAVEEMLRYRGTIRKQDRIATKDTEVRGVEIKRGDSIALWNGSASRDPEAIENPERFDITRKPNRHLALGAGIHMCVGNALARFETRIALNMFVGGTKSIEPSRGEDSYANAGNAVLECAKHFYLKAEAA